MPSTLQHLLLKVRPASLASFLASVSGLNARRFVNTDQGKFFINPVSVFGSSLMNGGYEPQMGQVLDRYLSPGSVFIDLGANEGYFSVLASKRVGNKGTVVALEPQSRLQGVIQTNFEANGCFNARLVRGVVSDKSGSLQLSLAPDTVLGSSTLFPHTKYRLPTEEVRSFSLSDLLDQLGVERCDLMKVDIEGAEYDVFMAAADVLRSGVIRNIALEFHPSVIESRGLSPETLHQQIINAGYELNKELGNWVYTFRG